MNVRVACLYVTGCTCLSPYESWDRLQHPMNQKYIWIDRYKVTTIYVFDILMQVFCVCPVLLFANGIALMLRN